MSWTPLKSPMHKSETTLATDEHSPAVAPVPSRMRGGVDAIARIIIKLSIPAPFPHQC